MEQDLCWLLIKDFPLQDTGKSYMIYRLLNSNLMHPCCAKHLCSFHYKRQTQQQFLFWTTFCSCWSAYAQVFYSGYARAACIKNGLAIVLIVFKFKEISMSSHQNNNNHNADTRNQAFLQSHGKEKKKKKNLPNFLVETIRGPCLSFDSFPSKRFTDFTCGRNTTWCKGRKCHTNLWWTTNDKILKTSWVMLENMKTHSRASVDGDASHVYVVLLYLLRQNYYRDTNLFYVFIFVLVFFLSYHTKLNTTLKLE